MARRANFLFSEDDDNELDGSARQPSGRVNGIGSLSPSPAASFSSDKENRVIPTGSPRSTSGTAKQMPPPKLPTPASAEDGTPRSNKRRKLSERALPNASQVAHEKELDKLGHAQYYDPNQSMAERRAVRKGIRDLSKELTGGQMTATHHAFPSLILIRRISRRIPDACLRRPFQDVGESQRDLWPGPTDFGRDP